MRSRLASQGKCFFCKSRNLSKVLTINKTFSLFKCKKCSLVFTFPQPNLRAIKPINDARYDSNEELRSRIAIFNKEYARAKKHIEMVRKFKKKGKYLDVGCSYGISVKAAKDLGFEAYGIEPTAKAVNYAKKYLKVHVSKATLESARLKSNSFDVITLYDVLEHVPNLHKFLKEVRRILKKGGLLVIQSPNIDSYAFKMLDINWNWLLVPEHLWYFSPKSIRNVLNDEGFLTVNVITQDVVYDFSSNLLSKTFSYVVPKNLIQKVFQKAIYILYYVFILLGSKIWNMYMKGGSLQAYAIKK